MKVGLVRHFPVKCPRDVWMTSREVSQWVQAYDGAPVHMLEGRTVSSSQWGKCYASDLPRAAATAGYIYDGSIVVSPLVREVPFCPVISSKVALPYVFWALAGRLAWYFSHKSQPESCEETRERARSFLDSILQTAIEVEAGILVVTHGFFMTVLQRELQQRGFEGTGFRRAEWGRLYVYERK